MTTTVPPTLTGFTAYLRNYVGITTAVLPDNSPAIPMAYGIALETVNPQLNQIGCAFPQATLPAGTLSIYTLAVYSLSTDNVFNYALDVQPPVAYVPPAGMSNPDGLSYFAFYRQLWKINDFITGVVESTGDEGTNVSLVVQEAAKTFTLGNLANLKTPWGRRYLALTQSIGDMWGLTA